MTMIFSRFPDENVKSALGCRRIIKVIHPMLGVWFISHSEQKSEWNDSNEIIPRSGLHVSDFIWKPETQKIQIIP